MGQGISYAPWMAIKSQVLADFVVEWTDVAASSHRPRILDDVLRRITDEERHRRGASLCFTPRGMHEVHGLYPLSLLQQCG